MQPLLNNKLKRVLSYSKIPSGIDEKTGNFACTNDPQTLPDEKNIFSTSFYCHLKYIQSNLIVVELSSGKGGENILNFY